MEKTARRILQILSIAVCIAIIVLSVLQLFDIWADAPYVYIPLMGVNLLLQAYAQWESSRKVAIFSLCCAGVIFICTAAVYLLK